MTVLPWRKDVFKRSVLLNCTVESCLWFLGSVKDKERQVNREAAEYLCHSYRDEMI